jgi:hypothetical protein
VSAQSAQVWGLINLATAAGLAVVNAEVGVTPLAAAPSFVLGLLYLFIAAAEMSGRRA